MVGGLRVLGWPGVVRLCCLWFWVGGGRWPAGATGSSGPVGLVHGPPVLLRSDLVGWFCVEDGMGVTWCSRWGDVSMQASAWVGRMRLGLSVALPMCRVGCVLWGWFRRVVHGDAVMV